MVRLVFRPYTHVGRSICTSEALRPSTRVSSGFNLRKHSSPSFGYQQVRSCFAPPKRYRTSRCCAASIALHGSHLNCTQWQSLLSLRLWVSYDPMTRALDKLLGPCFKTGQVDGLQQTTIIETMYREASSISSQKPAKHLQTSTSPAAPKQTPVNAKSRGLSRYAQQYTSPHRGL